jgi:hypothetical protein
MKAMAWAMDMGDMKPYMMSQVSRLSFPTGGFVCEQLGQCDHACGSAKSLVDLVASGCPVRRRSGGCTFFRRAQSKGTCKLRMGSMRPTNLGPQPMTTDWKNGTGQVGEVLSRPFL